jgi:hypothetical protein
MILCALVTINGIMASPVQEVEVEPRAIAPRAPSVADIPFPKMPVRNQNSNAMGSEFLSRPNFIKSDLDSRKRQRKRLRYQHSDECLFCR